MKFQTRIVASVASVLLVSFASPSFAGTTPTKKPVVKAPTAQPVAAVQVAKVPILEGLPLPILQRSIQLGRADPLQLMSVTVSMPYADSAAMEQFAESVSDPKSPNYRQFITPEQVGERFGISQERVQAISDYLKSQGLNVTMVAKNRLTVSCEGTVAQIETAFGTTIDQYVADPILLKGGDVGGNEEFIAPSTELKVPAHIAGDIIGVSGIETYTKPMHRAILTPTQTRGLYNTAPLYAAGVQGQGRTIGISNWDGYRLTNVPLYYTKYALPTPAGGVGSNVHEVKISGGAGTGTAGGEGDLDIQMVLGMAPLCEFYIYDGGASDLIGVLTREVNDNLCDVISESYGWNLTSSTWIPAHNLHLSMTTQGITYMDASGDSGTTLGAYDYPNYDPEVLMVGGTTATVNTTTGVRISETGWSGSGGGWSTKAATFNTRPSWQVGTGVSTTINYRMLPDLSFQASSTTGAYYFYYNGALSSGSIGTSFSSPVFAGMLGVAEQKLIALGGLPANSAGKQRFGRLQNLIYSQNGRTDVWFDVISGNNGNLPSGVASNCTAKWDYVTGWGCMDMNAFVTSQNPLFNITEPNGVPTQILPSGGTTMNVTITPITGTVAAGSQKLFYKETTASTWNSVLLASTGGYNYVATFPAASCNSTLQFYVQATSGSGIAVTLPTGGAGFSDSAKAYVSSAVLISDNFDVGVSNFTSGAAGDTATSGTWIQSLGYGATCYGSTTGYSGTKAWITAANGCVDVDGGKVSLLSPIVNASGGDTVEISFAYYLSYGTAAPTDDPLQVFVSNDGGTTWVMMASYNIATNSSTTTSTWSDLKTINVRDYVSATSQMRFKWVASDNGTDNVMEAGVDSVTVSTVTCLGPVQGDLNGDRIVNSEDLGILLSNFGDCTTSPCLGDFNFDGVVNSQDTGTMLLYYN